jgi:lipid-binding SYLF domain-containing protein
MKKFVSLLTVCLMFAGNAFSADKDNRSMMDKMKPKSKTQEATVHMDKAVQTLHKMEADSNLKPYLQQARGLFIIPDYARAATGVVGANGGAGVLVVRNGSSWSDPAFYNFGGVSAGIQAGLEAGQIAFILNNDKAINKFKEANNKFSLDADAGLTVVAWGKKGQADLSKADLIAWTDAKGLFAGAAIGLKDVNFDDKENAALYGKKVMPADILSGSAKATAQNVATFKKALPAMPETSSSTGGTSGK